MNPSPHLVLVGAGHAHLPLLGSLPEFLEAGLRVTVVAPGPFWYSGLGPALLGGAAEPAEDRIDVRALTDRAGATFIEDTVTRIESASSRIHLRRHSTLQYDALSLNVGSHIAGPPGAAEFAIPVKPIAHLAELRERLTARPRTATPLRAAIIGAGDAGVEIAGNLRRLLDQRQQPAEITLIGSAARPLPDSPPRAARLFRQSLRRSPIRLLMGRRVTEVRRDAILLDDGAVEPSDLTILASGVRPPQWLRSSGLAVADDGALKVNSCLQSLRDPRIFGAGDCVHFEPQPLPRVGVHAIRQAPVLQHNLRALMEHRPLRAYRPQSACLLIRNLGDGTGLLTWRGLVIRSRWALHWKNRLDRGFLQRHRARANS